MANEFKHKDPGSELSSAEYISASGCGHIFACQATGDIVYASSATVLSKLAKGSAGTVLSMGCSCIPAWTTNAASATLAATVTVIDSTDTSSFVALFDSATGDLAAKTDAGLAYNSGTGTLTATAFAGPITGNVTGNASGTALTVTQAAQCAITSLGTLTGLTLSGDATLTGAATDVDLIDNNACAISFDAAGQAGILAIDTQNCAEGVKMSGKLTVTGAISTTGAVTVGVDDTGHDVKFFGAAAGAFMLYDQSCDLLEIRGATAAGPGHLKLTTGEATVACGDVLGKIEFQAPAETGADALRISASIAAVAQVAFDATNNATDLIFYTGHSEDAAEKFRFTSQNEIGIAGANYGTDGQVLTSGGAGAAVAWEDAGGGGGACALQVNDSVALALGTGSDSQLYYDGTDTHLDLRVVGTGDLIIALAACHPSPDPGRVHIWEGSAGCVASDGSTQLTIEHSCHAGIQILTPATKTNYLYMGDAACGGSGGVKYNHSTNVLSLRTVGTDNFNFTGGPIMHLNDTANVPMSAGITINQGAADDEIFALKSSDVAHGITSITETDTFAVWSKLSGAGGGLLLEVLEDNSGSQTLVHRIYADNQNTAKTTGAAAAVEYQIRKGCGTGGTNLGANGNLLAIRDAGTTRFIWDVEGSAHADVEWTTYDDYCDIELLRGVHGALTPEYQTTFGQDMVYNLSRYEELGLVGEDSVHWEDRPDGRHQLRGMVNFTQLSMLHHSTIIQMADRFNARLDGIETQLKALTEGK